MFNKMPIWASSQLGQHHRLDGPYKCMVFTMHCCDVYSLVLMSNHAPAFNNAHSGGNPIILYGLT